MSSDQSNTLRDRVLTELAGIGSSDELGAWARRTLTLKNTMTSEDARLIEEAFRSRLGRPPIHRAPIRSTRQGRRHDAPGRNDGSREPSAPIVRTPESGRASAEMGLRNRNELKRTRREAVKYREFMRLER